MAKRISRGIFLFYLLFLQLELAHQQIQIYLLKNYNAYNIVTLSLHVHILL